MNQDPPILLFDGVCNLCDASVQFIIKRDPQKIFRFAPLQSEVGKELLKRCQQPKTELSTMVLIEEDQCFTKSDAALRIARHLKHLWPLMYGWVVLPRIIRDKIYDWVASHRYQWFGKKDQCMIPSTEISQRFLK